MLTRIRNDLGQMDCKRAVLVLAVTPWWTLCFTVERAWLLGAFPDWLTMFGVPAVLAFLLGAVIVAGIGWLLAYYAGVPLGEIAQALYKADNRRRALLVGLTGGLALQGAVYLGMLWLTWAALVLTARGVRITARGARVWLLALSALARGRLAGQAAEWASVQDAERALAAARQLLEDTARVLPEPLRSETLLTATDVLYEQGTNPAEVVRVTREVARGMIDTSIRARFGLTPSCTPLGWLVARGALGALAGGGIVLGILSGTSRVLEWGVSSIQGLAVLVCIAAVASLSAWVAVNQAAKRRP